MVAAGLFFYLLIALIHPEKFLEPSMTLAGWLQIALILAWPCWSPPFHSACT